MGWSQRQVPLYMYILQCNFMCSRPDFWALEKRSATDLGWPAVRSRCGRPGMLPVDWDSSTTGDSVSSRGSAFTGNNIWYWIHVTENNIILDTSLKTISYWIRITQNTITCISNTHDSKYGPWKTIAGSPIHVLNIFDVLVGSSTRSIFFTEVDLLTGGSVIWSCDLLVLLICSQMPWNYGLKLNSGDERWT